MRFVISSRTVLPVTSPRAAMASSTSVSTASGVTPRQRPVFARSMAREARSSAPNWRGLVRREPSQASSPERTSPRAGLAQGVQPLRPCGAETVRTVSNGSSSGARRRRAGLILLQQGQTARGAFGRFDGAAVLVRQGLRGVADEQGQLRFARGLLRAGHAEGLDGVPGLADTGRVRQAQQHAADAHRLLDGVARRAGDVRDDDAVIARQRGSAATICPHSACPSSTARTPCRRWRPFS